MKRALSLLLAVVLMLGIMPTISLPVFAADGDYQYTIYDGKATITGTSLSLAGDVVIPSKLGGATVVAIEYAAFQNRNMTSVKVPDTVKTLGDEVFAGCYSLKSVSLPKSLEKIGTWTFGWCNKLQSVTFGDKLTEIPDNTFNNCTNLVSVTFGKNIKKIGKNAFFMLPKLRKVYIKDLTAWCNMEVADYASHPMYYADELYLDGKLVTSVTVPSGVQTLKAMTFSSSKITSVKVPNTVTAIQAGALYGATGLKSLTIPFVGGSNSIIDDNRFGYLFNENDQVVPYSQNVNVPASLTSVTITNATRVGESAFNGCSSIKKIVLGKTVERVEMNAFVQCAALESVSLPSSIQKIGYSAFGGCRNLKHVYYCGTDAQKKKVYIEMVNDSLLKAKWQQHSYSDACDTSCNICKATRKAKHSYSNACDKTCNICKATRSTKHTYSYSCDKTCNVCKATRSASHTYKTVVKPASFSSYGQVVKQCTGCKKQTGSKTTLVRIGTVKMAKERVTYNGKAQKPAVVVKDEKGKTISSKYYTLTYSGSRKNVGTYKVTVKFKNRYVGTKTLTFKIVPKTTSISKLSVSKQKINVVIKKSTAASGYDVQYSTSKKFDNWWSMKSLDGNKNTKVMFASSKGKTTYYVRVRTYKQVNGSMYVSAWSAPKAVKVN